MYRKKLLALGVSAVLALAPMSAMAAQTDAAQEEEIVLQAEQNTEGESAAPAQEVSAQGQSAAAEEEDVVSAAGITLSRKNLYLYAGDKGTLRANVQGTGAQKLIWSSSDTRIATVDANGVVTGMNDGDCVITVRTADGKKSASCHVGVTIGVLSVTLDRSALSLKKGQSAALKAQVQPANATFPEVSWSSSKPAVASVDGSGRVTARSAGTAVIRVTTKDRGRSAVCTVSVSDGTVHVSGITLSSTSLTLRQGAVTWLGITVKPANASDKSLSLSSSDPSVVTVDHNAKVTAVAGGYARITVKSLESGKSVTCPVLVTFRDMERAAAWKKTAVNWALRRGITRGTSASAFSPDAFCTREQVVTFLYKLAGAPKVNTSKRVFSDVKSGKYYSAAVTWAAQKGVVSGIGGGRFGVGQTCTRAQVMAMLYRYAGYPKVSGGASFSDVKKGWQKAPCAWAAQRHISSGIGGGKFAPDWGCTRAQVMAFLYALAGGR